MDNEKIQSLYVEVRADLKRLERDVEDARSTVRRGVSKIEQDYAKLKLKFDTAVAKMNLADVQKLKQKLDNEFRKKLEMNVSAGSLELTRVKLESVNNALRDIKRSSDKAGDSTEGFAEKLTGKLKMLGAAIGFTAIVNWMRESVNMGIEATRSQAKVEQAIRTTGGAAGWTSLQLQRMAADLQTITGVGDDTVLNDVTAQLLTFTNVSGDVFRRAQVAALDLSAVIGNDLKSQTIQLGKALEDPIAGIGALSRAGVTFTQVQKEMIQNFMAQGDLAGAQKVILDEIEKKYGGQAKAMSEASAGTMQLSEAWGDLREAIGQAMTPLLTWLLPKVTQGIKGWIILLQDAREEFRDILKLSAADAREGFMEAVKGMSTELISKRSEELNSKIEKNKEKWQDLQKKIESLTPNLYRNGVKDIGVDDAIKKMQAQQKLLSSENAAYRNNISAMEAYKKKVGETGDASAKVWTIEGKTLGEVKQRIEQLQERLDNVTLGSKLAGELQQEIEALNAVIEGGSGGGGLNETMDKNLESLSRYYADVKFYDQDYFGWQLNEYRRQASEFEKILGRKFNREVWFAEQRKRLERELTKFISENSANLPEHLRGGDIEKPAGFNVKGMSAFETVTELKRSKEQPWYEGKAINSGEVVKEFATSTAIAETAFRSFGDAVGDTLGLIHIRVSETAGEVERVWVGMINRMIGAVTDLIAQWLVLNSIAAIFNLGGGFGAVGLGSLLGIKGASGGEFLGTSGGVKRLASGGDFMVPTGFSNDSYPLLVQSGERVQVTPAHRTGEERSMLAAINESIQALNLNFMRKDMKPVVVNRIDFSDRQLIKNKVIPVTQKVEKEGFRKV